MATLSRRKGRSNAEHNEIMTEIIQITMRAFKRGNQWVVIDANGRTLTCITRRQINTAKKAATRKEILFYLEWHKFIRQTQKILSQYDRKNNGWRRRCQCMANSARGRMVKKGRQGIARKQERSWGRSCSCMVSVLAGRSKRAKRDKWHIKAETLRSNLSKREAKREAKRQDNNE